MKDFHILVIRPGAIGDVLLTFPILKLLREHYTNTHITLVSNAQVLPLALAFGVSEEAFDFQDIQWSELFAANGICTPTMRELTGQTDLAICWLRDPDGIIEYNLRAAGVKRLIIAPGRPPEGERIHIVDYLAHTVGLQNVGAPFISPSTLGLINPDFKETFKQYIAIHPGSGGEKKCWPISSFAALIKRLWQQNHPVLLLEGSVDTERVCDLLQFLSPPPIPKMLKILTNAPLLEVARHLRQCKLYLGNDSGITHLAAMLGVPTIAIFGPSDPAVWRPVGVSIKVLYEHALENVSVDVVMEAIDL